MFKIIYCLLSSMLHVLKNAILEASFRIFPFFPFFPFPSFYLSSEGFVFDVHGGAGRGVILPKPGFLVFGNPIVHQVKKKILNQCTDYKRLILKY